MEKCLTRIRYLMEVYHQLPANLEDGVRRGNVIQLEKCEVILNIAIFIRTRTLLASGKKYASHKIYPLFTHSVLVGGFLLGEISQMRIFC